MYTFKTIEKINFWLNFVPTSNILNIYYQLIELYTSSNRDHFYNESIKYQTPYSFSFTFRSNKTPLTDNNKTSTLIWYISHPWTSIFSFAYATRKSRTSVYMHLHQRKPVYKYANTYFITSLHFWTSDKPGSWYLKNKIGVCNHV